MTDLPPSHPIWNEQKELHMLQSMTDHLDRMGYSRWEGSLDSLPEKHYRVHRGSGGSDITVNHLGQFIPMEIKWATPQKNKKNSGQEGGWFSKGIINFTKEHTPHAHEFLHCILETYKETKISKALAKHHEIRTGSVISHKSKIIQNRTKELANRALLTKGGILFIGNHEGIEIVSIVHPYNIKTIIDHERFVETLDLQLTRSFCPKEVTTARTGIISRWHAPNTPKTRGNSLGTEITLDISKYYGQDLAGQDLGKFPAVKNAHVISVKPFNPRS